MTKNITVLLSTVLCIALLHSCDKGDSEYNPPAFPQGSVTKALSYEKEISMLWDIVNREPDNLNAWIKLGNISMDTAKYEEAIEAYQNALKLNPNNVDVMVDMGTCYRRIGEAQRAADAYEKAIRIKPDHIYAHRNLGVVYAFDLHRSKDAIREFKTYLKLSPNAPDATQISNIINDLSK